MKRFDIALAAGLVLSIFLSSFTTFAKDCDYIRQNVVRLHILANSDSEADQNLKLAVRDRILAETSDIFTVTESKPQAEKSARKNLSNIEDIARDEIKKYGYDYPVKAEIVNMFFETRVYDSAIMPAGRYDAVRINIGDAVGKNWWCVLFPPMCIPSASEKLPEDTAITQLDKQPKYVPKLAVLELLESFNSGGK